MEKQYAKALSVGGELPKHEFNKIGCSHFKEDPFSSENSCTSEQSLKGFIPFREPTSIEYQG